MPTAPADPSLPGAEPTDDPPTEPAAVAPAVEEDTADPFTEPSDDPPTEPGPEHEEDTSDPATEPDRTDPKVAVAEAQSPAGGGGVRNLLAYGALAIVVLMGLGSGLMILLSK